MKTLLASLFCFVVLSVSAAFLSNAANAAPLGGAAPGGGGLYSWACGPKTCNCTTSDATLSICDSDEVSVDVGGGSPITVSTGHSTSSCSEQTVPGGMCIWKCYKFVCESHWYGWTCSPTGASALKNGPAGAGDCP
ncbi:MAG: hypothetical protein L6Q99_10540 [Planctomycetes bacterium]|nr:hypothetical protein [Planctomycetota bacterium]